MALSRYSAMDAYVTEEVRREYEAASPRGRISLLKRLQKDGLPFEIAALAAPDASVQVRQWFARNIDFNYLQRERAPEKEGEQSRERLLRVFSGRYVLAEALKSDPDPFVRACLRENTSVFSGIYWQRHFLEATPMERLALMRNREIGSELVRQVFDPEDVKLGITMEEREQLARAFLSNGARLAKAGELDYDARTLSVDLWQLALKWPEESVIPAIILNEVRISPYSKTKAEAYRACPKRRGLILYNCDWQDDETVKMGLQDPNEGCRERAFAIATGISGKSVDELINRKDTVALRGLAQNELVSDEDLGKIGACLREIDPDGFPYTWHTVKRKQKATISQDPDRLFGKEGRGLKEERINFIGRTMAGMAARRRGAKESAILDPSRGGCKHPVGSLSDL